MKPKVWIITFTNWQVWYGLAPPSGLLIGWGVLLVLLLEIATSIWYAPASTVRTPPRNPWKLLNLEKHILGPIKLLENKWAPWFPWKRVGSDLWTSNVTNSASALCYGLSLQGKDPVYSLLRGSLSSYRLECPQPLVKLPLPSWYYWRSQIKWPSHIIIIYHRFASWLTLQPLRLRFWGLCSRSAWRKVSFSHFALMWWVSLVEAGHY